VAHRSAPRAGRPTGGLLAAPLTALAAGLSVVLLAVVAAVVLLPSTASARTPADRPATHTADRTAAHQSGPSCTVRLGDRSSLVAAADRSDAVFAAKVTSVKKVVVQTSGVTPPRYWSHEVRLVASFRGSARAGGTAHLVLTPVRTKAGRALTKGATYLFFARQRSSAFSAPRCGGTVLLHHGLTSALRSRLTTDLSSSGGQGVDVHLTTPRSGVRDLPHLGRLLAPGAALALIGVLGLVLVGRMARERG
jgi:hypothetical protein